MSVSRPDVRVSTNPFCFLNSQVNLIEPDQAEAQMGHEVNGTVWPQLFVHEQTAQLRCLMTTLCDKDAHPSEWVFTADRASRYVGECKSDIFETHFLLFVQKR